MFRSMAPEILYRQTCVQSLSPASLGMRYGVLRVLPSLLDVGTDD